MKIDTSMLTILSYKPLAVLGMPFADKEVVM